MSFLAGIRIYNENLNVKDNRMKKKKKKNSFFIFFVCFDKFDKNGEYEMFNHIKSQSKTITTEIVYCVAGAGSELRRRGPHYPNTEISFPHEPHILFFVMSFHSSIMAKAMHGSMQQLDYYYTTTIFQKTRNDLVLFILSVTHGGCDMIIKCN